MSSTPLAARLGRSARCTIATGLIEKPSLSTHGERAGQRTNSGEKWLGTDTMGCSPSDMNTRPARRKIFGGRGIHAYRGRKTGTVHELVVQCVR
jgi:hypothetical protein